jgi:hypothetical protein
MSSLDVERQVILYSAGTAAHRAAGRARARRLTGELNWLGLVGTLRSRKLLPVLGPRILELAEGRAGGELAAAVEQALEAGRRQGAFLQLVSQRMTASLAAAGIRSAPLKGPMLGEAIYGDLGRRLSSDIDLLVSPDELEAAVEVVRGLGYDAPTDYVEDCGLPLLHSTLLHERGELPPVELHWRIHWYERSFAQDRLLPPSADALGLWRPAPADELAALLLFYARDGFIDLRQASDLSAWWDVYGAELAPGALDEPLGAYPALGRVLSVAAEVAEKIVGLPARQIIGGLPRRGLRERVAVRLANPHPRSSQPQLYADIGLIDGLLMPLGGSRAFVRRQLFPPAQVLEAHARHRSRPRARSSLGRAAGVLLRYALTMTRLVRAPDRAH